MIIGLLELTVFVVVIGVLGFNSSLHDWTATMLYRQDISLVPQYIKSVCVCVCICLCACLCVYTVWVWSAACRSPSLLLCEFQGLNSGCEGWSKQFYLPNHLFDTTPLYFETKFLYFVTQAGIELAILFCILLSSSITQYTICSA